MKEQLLVIGMYLKKKKNKLTKKKFEKKNRLWKLIGLFIIDPTSIFIYAFVAKTVLWKISNEMYKVLQWFMIRLAL